ncbi:MAG: ABC transporter ATP-binding protein [Gemmatimonadales bacterium]
MTPVLEARSLGRTYQGGDGSRIEVLAGLDLAVEPGEFLAVVGASGAGKSTLLQLLGALDRPSSGSVWLEGRDLANLNQETTAAVRNRRIGFVFQFHHLLRDFTAVENVMMPLLIAGIPEAEAAARARDVLGRLGLADRLSHYPGQLSGGEQQRAAVARAVAPHPAVVLADEPSGNLDPTNAAVLHGVLAELRHQFGTALVVATHNADLAARADRVLRLAQGRLVPEPREATA